MIEDLQRKLGALLLPPKKKQKARYFYEVYFREDRDNSPQQVKKAYSRIKARDLEDKLAKEGFLIIAVEYIKEYENGEQDIIWVY